MRHNVVGIVIGPVDASLAQDDAGDASERKEKYEPHRKEHWRFKLNRTAPHRGNPTEYLDTRGNRDDHCRKHEIALLCDRHADRIHVMRPNNETKTANSNKGPDHR